MVDFARGFCLALNNIAKAIPAGGRQLKPVRYVIRQAEADHVERGHTLANYLAKRRVPGDQPLPRLHDHAYVQIPNMTCPPGTSDFPLWEVLLSRHVTITAELAVVQIKAVAQIADGGHSVGRGMLARTSQWPVTDPVDFRCVSRATGF